LICFNANGVVVFLGSCNNVIQQLKDKHSLFMIEVYDLVHCTNLPVNILSQV
jgi:hypothetical protein